MADKKEKKCVSDNAQLMGEWNWGKNTDIDPSQLALGSHKKVWWKCEKGHEWEAIVRDRNSGSKCPYCTNHKVLKGFNDLMTINPVLAKEWDMEKNEGVTPCDVLAGSDKKAWWKCQYGHSFYAQIKSRNNGSGCPHCISEKRSSFPEKAILFYLKKEFSDALGGYIPDFYTKKEIDIYIPQLKIGIEYDGQYFHNNVEIDYTKNIECKSHGIELIRIREPLCDAMPEECITYTLKSTKLYDLKPAIEFIFDYINKVFNAEFSTDVNIDRDYADIISLISAKQKDNSLAERCPHLLDEWNYEKNGELTPDKVFVYSTRKVWWKCNKGHEWLATISNRSKNDTGCPYCTNRKVLNGFNDLETLFPEIAKEWDKEKNTDCVQYANPKSGKKVWWKCEQGHSWQATILSRTVNQNGCPYCSGLLAIPGENDLATTHPQLVSEWDFEKNGSLLPTNVKAGSAKKVWWKCEQGHSWQEYIYHRTKGGRNKTGYGCPYCSNKRLLVGFNDLETRYPELAIQWDYEKNKNLTPDTILYGSNKKVWWKCEQGHSWQATIFSRKAGHGCPYCSNQKHKLIYCEENGKLYEKYRDVELDLQISNSSVSNVLNGKQHSAKGYHFRFWDEE